ncbi:DUF1080 domain-containing protein [Haloferula chungangensis]|uniref:DUF1080 domain-containing protein n=1 Tax=Haloferula chungangensis TaxID=1048331 RepID=A0ABW2LAG1_9BACT
MMMKPSRNCFIAQACALTVLGLVTSGAGTIDSNQKDWYERYKSQENVPKPGEMQLNETAEPELNDGFVKLFNGKDLTGWSTRGGKSLFEVKDGVIVGSVVPDTPSTYLCTDRADFTDFVFTCELKWTVDLNSGVMFRAAVREKGKQEEVFGPQAEMEGVSGDRKWSGGVYGQSCGGYFYPLWLKEHEAARSALKPDGWNRITVEAKGKVVKTWVNGVPAAHWVDDGTYATGFFGLQVHKAKKGQVLFRDIRVKELKN